MRSKRRRKTVGFRAYREDGAHKRFSTRKAATSWAGPRGIVCRIKVNHNGTLWHEPI